MVLQKCFLHIKPPILRCLYYNNAIVTSYHFSQPTTGNRLYDGDDGISGFSRLDGDKAATNRDYDGSLTGGEYIPFSSFLHNVMCILSFIDVVRCEQMIKAPFNLRFKVF